MAPSRPTWLRLATSKSARFGAASLPICAKDSVRHLRGRLGPPVNSFKKSGVDQIEALSPWRPSDREGVIVFSNDQIIDRIHIVLLLFQIDCGFRGSAHERHVMVDLVAP